MENELPSPLFIFELANNHMGDIAHGIQIVREFGEVKKEFPDFKFAIKLQYRDLPTFIHVEKRGKEDVKYVKRFEETALTSEEFDQLVGEIRAQKFLAMATPFDESSVRRIVEQDLDFIKVASCSFTDWPLLEEIAKTAKPIIASTAGANITDIDRVVSFLKNREKQFAILHCVGQYPTPNADLEIGQIEFLRNRYSDVTVGFSTHEDPSNTGAIKLAIAKGASVFEKHIGVANENVSLNAYSINPSQARSWLQSAAEAFEMCGQRVGRAQPKADEVSSLRALRRGVYAKRDIEPGDSITTDDVYFAFPADADQFTANDWSKYSKFSARSAIRKDGPLSHELVSRHDSRTLVLEAAQKVRALLEESQIVVPSGVELELSHHYGMARFEDFGITLITIINRAYCKKILVCLPNQVHPEQYHKVKEETFHVLYGQVEVTLDGVTCSYAAGDLINIEPGVRHGFVSTEGAVIEEISSTHYLDDSYYTDMIINENKNRKTLLAYWMN